MSYEKSAVTKVFTWIICGELIIANMLTNKNNIITFPVKDSNGDIRYKGEMFTMKEMVIN